MSVNGRGKIAQFVVTFVAILELARLGRLAMAQEAAFGQIWIYPVEPGGLAGEPAEGAAGAEVPAEPSPTPTTEDENGTA